MTYDTLVAPKGAAGSIANWVNYARLDLPTIVDEAQSLIFQLLRIREMRTSWTFGVAVGQSSIALPTRFLDPVGKLYDATNGVSLPQRIETSILDARAYDSSFAGSLGANPFTTANGLSTVTVHEVAHGLNQGSTYTILGATAVAGLTLNGTFPIVSVVDADNFVIDAGDSASATATGGGAGATYTANNLLAGYPSRWGIFDEQLNFDLAFDTATALKLLYFRAPLPLSTANPSNWLTTRYPTLMRKACQASAADFMKDDEEYKKGLAGLEALIQSTAAESDLTYRGAEFGTDTP